MDEHFNDDDDDDTPLPHPPPPPPPLISPKKIQWDKMLENVNRFLADLVDGACLLLLFVLNDD